MENLFMMLANSFVSRLSSNRKPQTCRIGDSGCSLLFNRGSKFDKRKTGTGDDLYFNEFSEKTVVYGAICIVMNRQFNAAAARDMLGRYMNKLKGPFFVFHQVGQEKSKDWNQPTTISLVDHWQDAKGVDCKLKGYTNGKIIAILYVKNINEAETEKQEAFLDSFHFLPGRREDGKK